MLLAHYGSDLLRFCSSKKPTFAYEKLLSGLTKDFAVSILQQAFLWLVIYSTQFTAKYLKDEQVHPGCKPFAYSPSPHHHPHIYLALSIIVFWLNEGELI